MEDDASGTEAMLFGVIEDEDDGVSVARLQGPDKEQSETYQDVINEELVYEQKMILGELLEHNQGVFTNVPRVTNLEHSTTLVSDQPIRSK